MIQYSTCDSEFALSGQMNSIFWSVRKESRERSFIIGQEYPNIDKSKDSKANPLSVKNIGGVFVVLLGGLLVAIIVAVLEFCWNSRKNSQIDRQSLCSEMAEELR